MLPLRAVCELLLGCPDLLDIPFSHILAFLQYSFLAKPYIQSICLPDAKAPTVLPRSVSVVLARCLNWDRTLVLAGWEVFRHFIWCAEASLQATEEQIQRYNQIAGGVAQTSFRHLFPPTRFCIRPECPGATKLSEPVTHAATLHTLRTGSLSVYTTSLYCRKCHVRYHHNYFVQNASSLRIYYGGVPEVIQVAQHFFMEAAVLEFFVAGKVFGWLSGMNLARIYNHVLLPSHPHIVNNRQAFISVWAQYHSQRQQHLMRDEDVLNGFFLYSLLLDKAECNTCLVLPHDAPSQSERLRNALQERNKATEGIGQESYPHICDVCCHITAKDGKLYKMQAAVCDGNQMGHPCCAIHDCKNPLRSQQDLFCPAHRHCEDYCAVQMCERLRKEGFRTCDDIEHRALEASYFAKGTAMFQLRARLKKAGITVPMADSLPSEPSEGHPTENEVCEGKSSDGTKRIKAVFGSHRSHTQFLVMRPCGIILSRATLFGSEAVSAVNRVLHATFPSPESTPEFLFFDNNCKLVAHQRVIGDTHWVHTAQPVDVFHHQKKHRETDLFCQRYCNPAAFPELMIDGSWRFNSSICEQTNVWFGGYLSILRNMEVTRFNFYLDEMIKRHNRYVINTLEEKGHHPSFVPIEVLFP